MCELDLKILQYLFEHEAAASSDRIAKFCNVSKNTVRMQISLLNGVLSGEGLCITAKKSAGYQLCILDEKRAASFVQSLNRQLRNPLCGRNSSGEFKANYMIRRLLSARSYLPMNVLCEELFYSQSSVKKALQLADNILNDFQLKVMLKRGYGYYIEGEEWKKRLCLLSEHKIFVNLPAELQQREPQYARLLETPYPDFRQKKKMIGKMLESDPQLSFKLIEFPIILNYLSLIEQRKEKSKEICFTEIQMKYLKESGLIEKARAVFSVFGESFLPDGVDAEAFAMLLMAYRLVTKKEQLRPQEWESLVLETNELFCFLEERTGIHIAADEQTAEAFACTLYYVRNKILLHIVPDEENFSMIKSYDAIVEDLCVLTAVYLEKTYGMEADERHTLEFYYLYRKILDQCMQQVFSLRVLVASTYGYQYSCFIAEIIREKYGLFVNKAIPAAYSDLKRHTVEVSDAVLTDMREEMRPELGSEKILWLDLWNMQENRIPSLEKYIREQIEIRRRELIKQIRVEETITDFGSLLAYIAQRQSVEKNMVTEQNIERSFRLRKKHRHRDGILLTSVYDKSQDQVCIYEWSHAQTIKGHRFCYAVYYSYTGTSVEKLYLIRKILIDFFTGDKKWFYEELKLKRCTADISDKIVP